MFIPAVPCVFLWLPRMEYLSAISFFFCLAEPREVLSVINGDLGSLGWLVFDCWPHFWVSLMAGSDAVCMSGTLPPPQSKDVSPDWVRDHPPSM